MFYRLPGNTLYILVMVLLTNTKIFEHFRKSILSKQSKTSLEQDKLRNADPAGNDSY